MSDDLAKLYNLKKNPFASKVQPDTPLVGRKTARIAWKKAIEDKMGTHGSALFFIIGDYGLGKTHTLFHVKTDAEELKGVTAVFLKMLPEDEVKNFGLDFVRRIFKSLLDQEAATKLLSQAKLLPVADPLYEHSKIIRDYASGITFFRNLLIGGSFTKSELSKRGIHRPPVSTEIAVEYLTVLLVQLHSVGVKTLVLCVDEAEYIFSQLTNKKSALVFNAIRTMYDLTSTVGLGLRFSDRISNLVMFFAISADGWGHLNTLQKIEKSQGGPIQPLLSRVTGKIALSPLAKDETLELVEAYLKRDRVTGKKMTDALIPYESGFVDYLFDLTGGQPRKVVERCDCMITEGLRDGVKLLTKKYAKEVFERLGMAA